MKTLLIDDEKNFENVTKTARTYDDGIKLLETENWDALLLDCNFNSSEHNGLDVLKWLCEHKDHRPTQIKFVSSSVDAIYVMQEFARMAEYKIQSETECIKEKK